MPAERLTLIEQAPSTDKSYTEIVTIGAQLVELNQFSAAGEEIETEGTTFEMKYTRTIADNELRINGFIFRDEEYKRIDVKRDRSRFRITGERVT